MNSVNNYKNKLDKYQNNIFYKLYYYFDQYNTRISNFYIEEIYNINDDNITNHSFFL
jgi:hypothetical protein